MGSTHVVLEDLTGQKKNVSVRGMVTLWVRKYKNCLCLLPCVYSCVQVWSEVR